MARPSRINNFLDLVKDELPEGWCVDRGGVNALRFTYQNTGRFYMTYELIEDCDASTLIPIMNINMVRYKNLYDL